MKITYLGHSCFTIEMAEKKLIIDPFIKSNPNYRNSIWEKAKGVDYILLTHGHSDHIGDAVELAKTYNAEIISNYEICNWLSTKGLSCIDLNMGSIQINNEIEISMVTAIHSSSIELEDGKNIYGGLACGYVIKNNNYSIYHAGDTCVFGDMKIINEIYKPNIGLLPIGGRFTMSVFDAIYACKHFFDFDTVIPMHYDTFPPIKSDPVILKKALLKTSVEVLGAGDELIL